MQNQIIHNNMMQNGEHAVLPNSKWQYYIDKTKQLEKGIIAFPSIYIEGSAASGKTTAVEMLLDKYPQQEVRLFQMEKEWKEKNVLLEKIGKLAEEVKKKELWIVFDNMPEKNSVEYISKVYNQNQMEAELQEKQILESLVSLVKNLPQHSKIIFTGRGKLPGEFLELLWKRKIELFTIQSLLFTKEEIRILAEKWKSGLNYGQVYEKTGGWAGCVDMLFRFSDSDFRYGKKVRTIDELMDSYEIKEYIHREVMDTLPAGEQKLLSHAAGCPWITESLCQAIWKNKAQKSGKMQGPEIRQEPQIQRESEKIPAPEWYMDILDNLTRKGILLYNRKKKNWTISPLLLNYLPMNHVKDEEMDTEASSWLEQAAVWYEENGHVDEALYCLRQCKKRDRYLEYMKQHYAQLSFSGYQYPGVKNWRDKTPEACYLRGMYDYMVQNFTGLEKEIHMLENMQEKDQKTCEILLNLYYLKPDFSLNQWLELLEQYTGKEKMHLYHMLGNSCTFLCGVRDLSALFACTRKEENQKARVWKECLGKEEWRNYQLARIDFYLETGRQDAILEEDRILLEQENEKEQLLPERGNTKQQLMENWQFLLVKFYLLNKLQVLEQNTSYKKQIQELEQQLMQENQELYVYRCYFLINAGFPAESAPFHDH